MKIAQVSEQYDLSADTLRYYERVGLIPPVNRTESGIRDYNEIDLKRVEFIKCMRRAGLPVETLIEYIALFQQGDETVEARHEILRVQRDILASKIEELQKTLDLLDYKIARYEALIMNTAKELVEIEGI